jgi:hypothetical protein
MERSGSSITVTHKACNISHALTLTGLVVLARAHCTHVGPPLTAPVPLRARWDEFTPGGERGHGGSFLNLCLHEEASAKRLTINSTVVRRSLAKIAQPMDVELRGSAVDEALIGCPQGNP